MIKKIRYILIIMILAISIDILVIDAENSYENEYIKGNIQDISIELNDRVFKNTKEIIIVNEEQVVDAISATPLAYSKDVPIIGMAWKGIDEEVIEYFNRTGIEKATIIGGLKSISKTFEHQLEKLGIEVNRIYGNDMYETSLKIARELHGIQPVSEVVILDKGININNAIGIYSYAAKNNMPIIWSNQKNLKEISSYLSVRGIERVYVMGKSKGSLKDIEANIEEVYYIKEIDRNYSNISIIEQLYGENSTQKSYIVNGNYDKYKNPSEYISLGVVAAKEDIPILVTDDVISKKQDEYLKSTNVEYLIHVGGEVEQYSFIKIIMNKKFLYSITLIILLLVMYVRAAVFI